MAETIVLKAEERKGVGSKDASGLRRIGKLPVIAYGHKQKPVALVLNAHDFVEGLHHGHRIFEVQIGGKTATMLVKDLQYDPLGRDVIHADLIRVDLTETVKVTVPLERVGHLEEIADLVCFLASDMASYITGTVVNISGGKSRG